MSMSVPWGIGRNSTRDLREEAGGEPEHRLCLGGGAEERLAPMAGALELAEESAVGDAAPQEGGEALRAAHLEVRGIVSPEHPDIPRDPARGNRRPRGHPL